MFWRSWLRCFVFVIICYQTFSLATNGQHTYRSIHLPEYHVLVKFAAQDSSLALQTQRIIRHHYPLLIAFFETHPDSITIEIVKDHQRWQDFEKIGAPEWARGVYLSINHTIALNLTNFGASLPKLESVLVHELSHAFFDKAYKDSHAPNWLNEGLAEYLSGGIVELDPFVLASALQANSLPELAELENMHRFPRNKAQLAYMQCLAAVQYLFELLGDRRAAFFRMVKDKGWHEALGEMLQMDDIDFELEWYEYAKKRFRWYVIFNLENLLWIVGAIAVMAIFIWKIFKNRQKMRKWAEEQQSETAQTQLPPDDEVI